MPRGPEEGAPRRRGRGVLVGLAVGLWLGAAVGAVRGAIDAHSHAYAAKGLWLNALRALCDPLPAALALGALLGIALGAVLAVAGPRRWSAGTRGPGPAAIAGLALVPVVGALALVAGGRLWAERRAAAVPDRLNVVLLLVDALRADRLGAYGHARDTSPTIDRLASESALFTRAVSPADKTRTAMASLWTGLYPSRHGLFSREHYLSHRLDTAAEWAREAGYRTAAFTPNPSLDRSFGHAQGWDVYVDRELRADDCDAAPEVCYETAARIQALALDWLDAEPDRPFLLWMHYRDVHGPYVPPPPYDRMFRGAEPRPISRGEARRRDRYLDLPDDGDDLNHYLDRYDGEIRYTDDHLAELLAALEARDLLDRTLIVLAADHGEEFLDHGGWDHGHSLFEELLHVPLIVRWPGAPPRVETRPISTLAFFPTILHAMGIEPPPSDGVDLVPWLRDGEPLQLQERVFSERKHGRMRSVRDGRWKWIANEEEDWSALYDLDADPGEREDRAAADPSRAAALREQLASFGREVESGAGAPAASVELDDELRERLEALGYVE